VRFPRPPRALVATLLVALALTRPAAADVTVDASIPVDAAQLRDALELRLGFVPPSIAVVRLEDGRIAMRVGGRERIFSQEGTPTARSLTLQMLDLVERPEARASAPESDSDNKTLVANPKIHPRASAAVLAPHRIRARAPASRTPTPRLRLAVIGITGGAGTGLRAAALGHRLRAGIEAQRRGGAIDRDEMHLRTGVHGGTSHGRIDLSAELDLIAGFVAARLHDERGSASAYRPRVGAGGAASLSLRVLGSAGFRAAAGADAHALAQEFAVDGEIVSRTRHLEGWLGFGIYAGFGGGE